MRRAAPKAPKPRKLLERDVQRQVMHLLALAGCETFSTSQGFRADPGGTRMTPGLADLLVFLPEHLYLGRTPFTVLIGFIEVKTEEGLKDHQRRLARRERRAVAQDRFGQLCRARGIPYAIGGVEATWAFLASVGLAERERAPHIAHVNHGYRLTPRRTP